MSKRSRCRQPRIVARNIDLPFQFAILKDRTFDAKRLLELPRAYSEWIDGQEKRLRDTITAGLTRDDAAVEKARLAKDIAAQRAEARYIERGVEILIASKEASDQMAGNPPGDGGDLARRAAPWMAWTLTNEAFALRDAHDTSRGWRLFQMAFVLAHIPVFASRMTEWRGFHDSMLDEDGVSLLYFPTGGGKSEAFYGTLLFAMFLDRLRGKDRGVTALIRYPLRLLTLQQAQRLLKLVVRAEMVRRRQKVGGWPFEMGFWVGSQNTPNHYGAFRADIPLANDADFADDSTLDGETGDEDQRGRGRRYAEAREAFDKIPECPVCGEPTGLRRDENEGPTGQRAAIVCFNDRCAWNREHGRRHPLPFLLTDDAIYARAPAIVLGTVDKLAMLGQHTGTISKVLGMFGLARRVDQWGNLYTPRREEDLRRDPADDNSSNVHPAYANGKRVFHDPFPSLIIQDEAHLLEESLGTFSGLFDTLLDAAFEEIADMGGDGLGVARRWTGDGWGAPRMPKVIAATATISAPERQLETLYQRHPLRFPYPGPDLYHSFFAEPAPPPAVNPERVELAKRLPFAQAPEQTAPWMRFYVSLMTNDATHTVTTVGVLAAFHGIVTALWDGMIADDRRATTIASIRAAVSPGRAGDWRRAAIDRAVAEGRQDEIMALVDLHRIALAYSRVSSTPVYNREYQGQSIDMPVRLKAFDQLPIQGTKRPIYVTQQRNEALYFKLDEARVIRWLKANGVSDVPDEALGRAFLERYEDFGPFLEIFKDREGTGGYPRTVPTYVYLLLHTLSHQMMHSLADTSGIDRDGTGEHIFPANLAFVIYRKGMTPDLGNISAMWRNHSDEFLRRGIDPRTLRCGSGSLCDVRGGACPACIMVSEVSCIASNLLLSRAVLKGGRGPEWEPRSAPDLVGFLDPAVAG